MGIGSELTGEYSVIAGEYLDSSKFELVILGHDGVVVIVVEEHYVGLMLEAVRLVTALR